MTDRQKQSVSARLKRIEGQIAGVRRMIDDDRYCVDILTQTRAVAAALRGVEDFVMENHLNTCVSDAMRSDDEGLRREKVDEVMSVISKFRKHG